MTENIIFYDCEVFQRDWLIVFHSCNSKVVKEFEENAVINSIITPGTTYYIWDDPIQLRLFLLHHKNYIFVGYNNRRYDSHILEAIIYGMDVYLQSKSIILNDKVAFRINPLKIKQFDIMPNPPKGLKEQAYHMGLNILESSVSFDQYESLTKEQKDDVLTYCIQDVNVT